MQSFDQITDKIILVKKNVMTIHTQPTSTQGLGVLKTIQKSPVHTLTVKNLAINLEGITKNTSLYTVARRWIYNGKVEEAEEDVWYVENWIQM